MDYSLKRQIIKADVIHSKINEHNQIQNLILKEKIIKNLHLTDIDIPDAKIKDIVLQHCYFYGIYFYGCVLNHLYFYKSYCEKLGFGLDNKKNDFNFIKCVVKDFVLDEGLFFFSNSTLIDIDFNKKIYSAKYEENKSSFLYNYCRFYDCNFKDIDFKNNSLVNSEYYNCDFTGAIYNHKTKFPDNFNPESKGMIFINKE